MTNRARRLLAEATGLTRWLRVVGDTIFAIGIVVLGYFVVGLKTGWSVTEGDDLPESAPAGDELNYR